MFFESLVHPPFWSEASPNNDGRMDGVNCLDGGGGKVATGGAIVVVDVVVLETADVLVVPVVLVVCCGTFPEAKSLMRNRKSESSSLLVSKGSPHMAQDPDCGWFS